MADDQSLNDIKEELEDFVLNEKFNSTFHGQDYFEGICLSSPTELQPPVATITTEIYNPIRVRIPTIHDNVLPNPCSKTVNPLIALNVINSHPLAFGLRPAGDNDRPPKFGEPLRCYFAEAGPDDFGKAREIRYEYPLKNHTFEYDCATKLSSIRTQKFDWDLSSYDVSRAAGRWFPKDFDLAPKTVPWKSYTLPLWATTCRKTLESGKYTLDGTYNPTVGPWQHLFLKKLAQKVDFEFDITSATRTALKQAKIFKKRLDEGKELYSYTGTGLEKLKKAYPDVNKMKDVLDNYPDKHISGLAIDIRSRNLCRKQIEHLISSAISLGADPKNTYVDEDPPHINVELLLEKTNNIETEEESAESETTDSSSLPALPAGSYSYHYVKDEEMFGSIAIKYKISISKLQRLNPHVKDIDHIVSYYVPGISPGQWTSNTKGTILIVPGPSKSPKLGK